jgi:hypothetical protein
MTVKLHLLKGEPKEMAELQRVLEGAPNYAERVTGLPPGAAEAQSTFTIVPEGIGYSDKFVWGVMVDDGMVGCIDVIRGWPSPEVLPFWHRMGFVEIGEVKPYRYDKLNSHSIILTKRLS